MGPGPQSGGVQEPQSERSERWNTWLIKAEAQNHADKEPEYSCFWFSWMHGPDFEIPLFFKGMGQNPHLYMSTFFA